MGVLVLNPQDCIQNPLSSSQSLISPPQGMKFPRNPNPGRRSRAQQPNHHRKNRSPNSSPPARASVSPSSSPPKNNFVLGQVKILKRGEHLAKTVPVTECKPKPAASKGNDTDSSDLGSIDRIGPDPELLSAQIRFGEPNLANGFYAGSAFITSPPPSSVPLPAFFTKKTVEARDDVATSGLCKLLGLNI